MDLLRPCSSTQYCLFELRSNLTYQMYLTTEKIYLVYHDQFGLSMNTNLSEFDFRIHCIMLEQNFAVLCSILMLSEMDMGNF